ncbi:MAG: collagenase-like protease [Bacteroidetes bacterium]|nr:MAG: collagenase-like protease [Bacteroidota bacterium]
MTQVTNKVEKKIEVMAPAGSWEALRAAIQGGADSVYFGIEQLNMRARASSNFTLEDLREIAETCNEVGVRTYITLNTIIYDHDLTLMKSIVDTAKESGITAIIASDQAVIGYAASKKMEVHISTQCNVTNLETVRFFSHFADVIVLSRELSLIQVKEITRTIEKESICGPSGELVQIEIFAHGALCVAVSGKCYMSLHTNNSSANRGACVQNCRKTYTITDTETGEQLAIDNEFIMSPKDLCTIGFIDQVIDSGVTVLKLEGRGRAPEYVKTVTECYRKAADAYLAGEYTKELVVELMTQLETVYNRGFWDGYYLGQRLGEWAGVHGSKATKKKIFLGKAIKYYPKIQIAEFQIDAQALKSGDNILITGKTTGVLEFEMGTMRIDDESRDEAKKGDRMTFPLETTIRPGDKIYKMIDA